MDMHEREQDRLARNAAARDAAARDAGTRDTDAGDMNARDEGDADRFRPDAEPRVAALGDLGDFQIADGYPDPRGWRVIASDGTEIGTVHDLIVDTGAMRTRYLDVRLSDLPAFDRIETEERDVLVPVGAAQLAEDDDEVMLASMTAEQAAALPAYTHGEITREYENSVRGAVPAVGATTTGATSAGAGAVGAASAGDFYAHEHFDDRRFYGRNRAERAEHADTTPTSDKDEARMIRSEEELDVTKRKVSAGEATLHKTVETEHVHEPVTVQREEVTIERRPVRADAASNTTISSDENEIRIPVMEEEVVVEKRPVVKEEIVVRKHAVSEDKDVEADLRKERVDVNRDTAADVRDRGTDSRSNP